MNLTADNSWKEVLQDEFDKDYFKELSIKVKQAYKNDEVYPPQNLLFNAFVQCSFADVKVVILGQDPYHGENQAMGLSFSVPPEVKIPPSLKNIYKEIESDLNIAVPKHGNLERWAKQGVLLLNATLTVRASEAGSHQGWGWETFTDAVIKTISNKKDNVVFMLWGNYARSKAGLIDKNKHLILEAPHPSPLSSHRGFFGCKHFSKANQYLKKTKHNSINW